VLKLKELVSAETNIVSDFDGPHSLFDNTYTVVVKPLWPTAEEVVLLRSLIPRLEVSF
jgi:hypothetical protein